MTKRRVVAGAVAGSVRRVYMQRSPDGGRSWSPQRDITESVKAADWRWYAVGPGHAVALRRGPHRGRLLVPANHSAGPTARSGAHSVVAVGRAGAPDGDEGPDGADGADGRSR
ncbi:hypothetical protein ACIRQP_25490 [Streptomyces sp. NPDC102274]|uniref:hypothetical protein n=1 Tax=Streptomyces sp. NPDC102274 TaxID=3366151 RepID=UPI0037F9947C